MNLNIAQAQQNVFWNFCSVSYQKIKEGLKQTAAKIASFADKLLEAGANKLVEIGMGLPATRDVTNFSTDPVFWQKIFIRNLEKTFKRYEVSKNKECFFEELEYYIRESFNGKVLVSPQIVTRLISCKIKTISNQTIREEAMQRVANEENRGPIKWVIQTHRTQKCANSHLVLAPIAESRSITPAKLLLAGLLFASALPTARAGFLSDKLRNDLNNRNYCLKEDRFSMACFLKRWMYCPPDSQCKLDSEIFKFDCESTNLKFIDFSNVRAKKIRFLASPPSLCNLKGAKFENSTFDKMIADYADFSDSILRNSTFDKAQLTNCAFNYVEGDGSFQHAIIKNTSWINLNGTFNFASSNLSNVDMRQVISSECSSPFQKSVEYNVTGAAIDGAQWTITFPNYIKTALNISTRIVAEAHPHGTMLKSCRFNLEGYENLMSRSCRSGVKSFFNLTDTLLSDFVIDKPKENLCSDDIVRYGGEFKNATFPAHFKFPIEGKIGCSRFILHDVHACGYRLLRETNYKCLTNQCEDVQISNDSPLTLREKFEDALQLRNQTLLNRNLFSITKFLKSLDLCSANSTFCDLPEELASFDCEQWNLEKVDYSHINAENLTVISKDMLCSLRESNFKITHFNNAVFENVDLSDSKWNEAVFRESHILSSKLDNLDGSASFEKSEIKNSTLDGCSGNINFTNVYLADVKFRQFINSQWSSFNRKTEYRFTASTIDRAEFSINYLRTGWSAIHAVLALIANENTLFNATSFNTVGWDGWGSGNVTWIFNFTDTSLPESSINFGVEYDWHDGPALLYGGNLKNVSFAENFKFPEQTRFGSAGLDCTRFTLDNVTGCGLPYPLSESNKECLTGKCSNVDVINNQTTFMDNFYRALKEKNIVYLTESGQFDIHNYFALQGVCEKESICRIEYPIFNEKHKLFEQIFWNKVAVGPVCFDQVTDVNFFENNITESSFIVPASSSNWKNSIIKTSSVQVEKGDCALAKTQMVSSNINSKGESIVLTNSRLSGSAISADGKIAASGSTMMHSKIEARQVEMSDSVAAFSEVAASGDGLTARHTRFAGSTASAPIGKITLSESMITQGTMDAKNINMLNSIVIEANIKLNSGRLEAFKSDLAQSEISGQALQIQFSGGILRQVNWNISSEKTYFFNSDLIDVEGIENAEFRNISQLQIALNNTNPIWTLRNIKNLDATLSNVSLMRVIFENAALSGIWNGGGEGSEDNLPKAANVRLESITFVKVPFCGSLVQWKAEQCLEQLGYQIRQNVVFEGYDPSMSPKAITKIILGTGGFVLGVGVLAAVLSYCVRRRAPFTPIPLEVIQPKAEDLYLT